MIRFAILSFPGTNCESETARAFRQAGMEAEGVRWNDAGLLDGSRCDEFDGYCLAGGFSYEDRSRSGVIAARNPIMEVIKKEAAKGKVVLGICNGAQILVESGLIPGYENQDIACALASNEMRRGGEVVDTGFRSSWCFLKNMAPRNRSAFNRFTGILNIPYANGEGRFVFRDPKVLEALERNSQVVFRYCDERGKVDAGFPTNPNGSVGAIAALCNPAGNVLAIMPHPERDPRGNGSPLFRSIGEWVESRAKADYPSLGTHTTPEDTRSFEPADIEFLVRPMIRDNTKRTVEDSLRSQGFGFHLRRYAYWSARVRPGLDKKEVAVQVIRSGELANLNKEWVTVRIGDAFYQFDAKRGLVPVDGSSNRWLVVREHRDVVGESKLQALRRHGEGSIEALGYGVLWEVEKADEETLYNIIRTKILYNPNSMYVMKN